MDLSWRRATEDNDMADFQGGTMGALLYVATSSQTISSVAAAGMINVGS